ncbi:MAG: hypothetical protein WCD79_22255, partial [Chthoniobacteraceae bacterium]
IKPHRLQPPDAENRTSGGVGALTGVILSGRPDHRSSNGTGELSEEAVADWDLTEQVPPGARMLTRGFTLFV